MKAVWTLIAIMFCWVASPALAEMEKLTLNDRDYLLYQPDGIGDAPLPLIVALHGSGGNAAGMANHLPLFEMFDEQKFRIVYLNGTKYEKVVDELDRGWNDGSCCGENLHPEVDDSAFIDSVIKELIAKGLVQSDEIYMVGHSNGAKMSYRYVCDHGGVIKALVAISGARDLKDCPGITGMRVLNIHGSDDQSYPIGGGKDDERPTLVRDPIAAAGETMKQNGADYHLVIVPGAGHRLPSIDRILKKTSGVGLTEAVLKFIFSGEIPKP